jgi:hypothetical protein
MSTRERTLSFRASGEIAAWLERLPEQWPQLVADDASSARLSREFQVQLARRFEAVDLGSGTQSDVIRAAVESLVGAVEALVRGEELREAYAAWASEDDEGEAFRDAALRAGESVWREP